MSEEIVTKKRVAIYLRVSTDEQVAGYGSKSQLDAVKSMIASKAYSDQPFMFAGDEHIYFDDGVSGTIELADRPAFARLMEALKLAPEGDKPFDAIAVFKIDRFARKLSILLDAIQFFNEQEVQFISVHESIDTSTPFGRAMLNIVGVIAELERDTISERTRGGWLQAAKEGVRMGNSPNYGFDKNESKHLVVFEREAKVVRKMFDLFVNQKKSVYEISDWLKENKHVTPDVSAIQNGKRQGSYKNQQSIYNWNPEAIRRLLQDEIYVGRLYYQKQKDGKKLPKKEWKLAPAPQLVDETTFQKAQKIFEVNKRQRKNTRDNHTYLLSGLLRCEACRKNEHAKYFVGQPQTVKSTGKRVYYYRCKGTSKVLYKDDHCRTTPIPADAIEDYVVSVCKKILSNPKDTFEYQQRLKSTKVEIKKLKEDEDRVIKLIEGIPARKAMLSEQHEMTAITSGELMKRIEELNKSELALNKQITEIQKKLSQNTLNKEYEETFKLFNKKYRTMLENVAKNRLEVYDLLHAMIDEITVYSRPLTSDDKIAGRKKEGRLLPHRIHIKFKLPQEMLNVFGHQKAEIIEKAPLSGASSSQKDVDGARRET